MKLPEERLEDIRRHARERARAVDNVLDATRLVLQTAPVLGIAADGRPIMGGMTVYEIRLKLADLGLTYGEQDVARAAEELITRGEANLVHTESGVPAYQWWPPAAEDVA